MSECCNLGVKIRDYIRLTAPEFNTVGDDVIGDWIEYCRPFVSKKQFGQLFPQALAYFICHKMKMAGLGENIVGSSITGSSGAINAGYTMSSVSDGGTSISFASAGGVGNTTTDVELTQTMYGSQFLQLRKMCVIPIHVSGESDFCV